MVRPPACASKAHRARLGNRRTVLGPGHRDWSSHAGVRTPLWPGTASARGTNRHSSRPCAGRSTDIRIECHRDGSAVYTSQCLYDMARITSRDNKRFKSHANNAKNSCCVAGPGPELGPGPGGFLITTTQAVREPWQHPRLHHLGATGGKIVFKLATDGIQFWVRGSSQCQWLDIPSTSEKLLEASFQVRRTGLLCHES